MILFGVVYREVLEGESIVVVGAGNAVIGLDRETGGRRWRHDVDLALGGAVHGVRVIDRMVAALAGHWVVALDYRTGALCWKHRLAHPALTLLVHRDRWFVAGQGEVTALSEGGEALWHDRLAGLGLDGPAMAIGDRAVTTTGDTS